MCERTARKYRKAGRLPRDLAREHDWRTRRDPFEGIWAEVQELLESAPDLQSKTIFEEHQKLYPGAVSPGAGPHAPPPHPRLASAPWAGEGDLLLPGACTGRSGSVGLHRDGLPRDHHRR